MQYHVFAAVNEDGTLVRTRNGNGFFLGPTFSAAAKEITASKFGVEYRIAPVALLVLTRVEEN